MMIISIIILGVIIAGMVQGVADIINDYFDLYP